eukprot:scaffold1984_cov162-Amphora_coffeaeformis.AAC.8
MAAEGRVYTPSFLPNFLGSSLLSLPARNSGAFGGRWTPRHGGTRTRCQAKASVESKFVIQNTAAMYKATT